MNLRSPADAHLGVGPPEDALLSVLRRHLLSHAPVPPGTRCPTG